MPLVTPPQCRAARGLLDWSQPELAEKCGMHVQTISAFENETSTPTNKTLEKISLAFETAGIELRRDGGVSPYAMKFKQLEGAVGFQELVDDIYDHARTLGGTMLLWNAKPANWIKWLGEHASAKHSDRMEKIQTNLDYRITAEEGDTNFISHKFAEYRWVPKRVFNDQSIYCYGNRIVFVNFEEDRLNIYVLYSWPFADSFRLFFDYLWNDITMIPNIDGYKPQK